MNWLLIIVVVLLAFCIMEGYRRGILRMLYSLISWVLILVFVSWATPYINNFLIEETPIYNRIETYCENTVRQKAEEKIQENSQNIEAQTQGEIDEAMTGDVNNTAIGINDLSELGVNLPDSVLEDILGKTSEFAGNILEESGVYKEISKGIAGFIVQGIAFFIALLAAYIISHVILKIVDVISKIPILSNMNRLCGMIAGFGKGILLTWVGFYLVAICSSSEIGSAFVSYIYDSQLLTWLYENNLVLTLILSIF